MITKKTKSVKMSEKISESEKQKEAFVKIQNKIQANKDKFTISEKIKYLSFVIR